jgi:6-methylsalicylate decarboxylase
VRIDVHAHYFAPEYVETLSRLSGADADARRRSPGPSLTLQDQIGLMDSAGMDMQVLSPGPAVPHLADRDNAVAAARLINDLYADIVRTHNGRFAAFVSVPLPHVEEALKEVERGLDTLGMVGVAVGCSVVGKPLDDESFNPFFAEIHRRRAVLFLHPVGAGAGPGTAEYGLTWMVGAPFEDTISALRLVLSGVTARYPNMKVIVPHLGGTLPFLLARVDVQAANNRRTGAATFGIDGNPSEYLKKLWFDTVNLHPAALRCACESFGADRLLLGTDYPFHLGDTFRDCVSFVERAGLSEADTTAILDRNAAELLGIRAR